MSMADDNLERLRARLVDWDPMGDLEALERGEALDLSLIDPDVVYEDANLPDHAGDTYHGAEGVVRAIETWLEPYESFSIELERIVGEGDRFVSIHRGRMKARHTGIELETPVAYTWTFRDGRITHIHGYFDPAEALRAAGLRDNPAD